jgi:hypothetical protein
MNYSYHFLSGSELRTLSSFSGPFQLTGFSPALSLGGGQTWLSGLVEPINRPLFCALGDLAMRCDVSTLGDFLYRIALGGFHFGYFHYAVREIPHGKDLEVIDRKLMDTYKVTACRMKRRRQRLVGQVSVQYVRLRHTFILLATDGIHAEFAKVKSFDARTKPLHLSGYSIGCVGERVSVRVAKHQWQKVKAYHDRQESF